MLDHFQRTNGIYLLFLLEFIFSTVKTRFMELELWFWSLFVYVPTYRINSHFTVHAIFVELEKHLLWKA